MSETTNEVALTTETAPAPKFFGRGKAKTITKKSKAPKAETVIAAGPTPEMWAALVEALRQRSEPSVEDVKRDALIHAQAMKKALMPENADPPDISAYNPTGLDRRQPQYRPTHQYFLGPFPICAPNDYLTNTVEEVALWNQIEPGDYVVTKSDGQRVKAVVTCDYEANGTKKRLTRLTIPMQDQEMMANWPPMLQLLSEIVHKETPAQSYARYQKMLDEANAKIADLTAQMSAVAV